MSRTAITLKFKMRPPLDEACSCAEKLLTDINLPYLVPDEDNNFGGSSKNTNCTRPTGSCNFFVVFEKFTCAYLFHSALEII